ncbi:AP2-like ethylene-responsive transcription factor BBM2, partial [Mucuna pruriens]
GFKNELEAAKAHDLVAIKIWGNFAYTNFPESCYLKEISEMKSMTKREYILSIRSGQQQNHDGVSAFTRAEVAMEETNVVGETFPNQDPLTMQPMLPKSGQESQTSIALKNQHESVNESLSDNQFLHDQYQDLAFQNDLSFQNDLPHWSFYFDYTKTLDNALNWESSIQMGNGNPNGAENGGIDSFGFSSIGFHLMEPNNQQFEAPNPQIELDHRYEALGYEFGRNTWFEGENMIDNDFDINQYLNLNNLDMEDQETAADFTNELW